jgi:hypothetical protein
MCTPWRDSVYAAMSLRIILINHNKILSYEFDTYNSIWVDVPVKKILHYYISYQGGKNLEQKLIDTKTYQIYLLALNPLVPILYHLEQ